MESRPIGSARRLQLMAAARQLFTERGFAGTSIRDIAKAAQIESASIYYHFPSKSDLFVAVQELGIKRMHDAVASAVSDHTEPWSRLEAAASAHCRALLADGGFRGMIMPHLPTDLDAVTRDKLVAQRDDYETMFDELIHDLDLPKTVNPGLFKQALLGSLNWTSVWYRRSGPFAPEQIGREFVALLRGQAELANARENPDASVHAR